MSGNNILAQTTQNQQQPDATKPAEWLTVKIAEYEAQATKLESQLNHVRVLIRGHKIWLSEVEKAGQR